MSGLEKGEAEEKAKKVKKNVDLALASDSVSRFFFCRPKGLFKLFYWEGDGAVLLNHSFCLAKECGDVVFCRLMGPCVLRWGRGYGFGNSVWPM